MKFNTDEEIDAFIIQHAKHFNVVQMNPGGFVNGSRNYLHHVASTIDKARAKAETLYREDPKKRGIVIYAVADIGYVANMSRPVENYPPVKPYMSKAARAKLERDKRASERLARHNSKG